MKMKLNQNRRGAFTLVEIMVVVVILGILAATIIPQFVSTTQDAKIGAAKADVAQLKNAIERFNIHMDRFPTTEEGLKALVEAPSGEDKKWKGPYLEKVQNDPWGNAYQYRAPSTHRKGFYDVWSRGSDNADGGEEQAADIGNW
jgi:general secretion pathway protein G